MADSVEDLNLTPPQNAQDNAQKVLDWRDEHGDEVNGMTRTGWVRANQLANGEELSPNIVKKMSQFNRHRKNSGVSDEYRGEPWKDAGHVAWLGWGGDEGIDWAMRMSERIKSIENSGRDKVTTLAHKHESEDEEGDEKTVENQSMIGRISGSSNSDNVDSKEISVNTYNGYFEDKDFDDENWADAVDRLREMHGTARSFITRIVKHEDTGHDREDNVPVFEEPIDSDTIEQFVNNVEENIDEDTFENVVEDVNKLDNTIKRLFFRVIMHDDFMHDRDDFEIEQLLSEENAAYSTYEDCVEDRMESEDISRAEAESICEDMVGLEDDNEESGLITRARELDEVSEDDKVRWDGGQGTAYGVVDTVTQEGTVSAEPEGPEMDGSEDEPAVKIEVYDLEDGEWTGTDIFVVHRFEALTRIEDFPEERENSETMAEGIIPTHEGLGDYGTQESDDWSRPNYSEFKDNYDLEEQFADLENEDKRVVAAHFGRVDNNSYEDATYSDLQLPHHNPSNGDVDRAAIIAARQRLNQSDMPESDMEAIDTHLTEHLREDFDEEDVEKVMENSDDTTQSESVENKEGMSQGQLVSFTTEHGKNYGRVKEDLGESYSIEIYRAELGGGWKSSGKQKVFDSEKLSEEDKFPNSLNDVFKNNNGSNVDSETVDRVEEGTSEEVEAEGRDTSAKLSPTEVQQVGKKVRNVSGVLSDDELGDYLDRQNIDYTVEEFRELVEKF